MKKSKIFKLFFVLNLFFSLTIFAQDPGSLPPDGISEDGDSFPPNCMPPPCVPIDGGIVFLIAAGAAYGSKKIVDYRKQH